MAGLDRIDGIKDWLAQKIITERRSYAHVSKELQELYPHLRGLSSRSIRRFCSTNGIHATSRLTDSQLDRVVASNTSKVSMVRYWEFFVFVKFPCTESINVYPKLCIALSSFESLE